MMNQFLDDISNKLKQPTVRAFNSSNIMSHNQDKQFFNKPHTPYPNNPSYNQPYSSSDTGLNNRTERQLQDRYSRFVPNNSFMNGSPVYSLFHNTRDKQSSQRLGSINEASSLFGDGKPTSHYSVSNGTQQTSDGNESRRYFNDISSQYSRNDDNFKRPHDVRHECTTRSDLTFRYQKSDRLGVANLQNNCNESTVANKDQSFVLSRPRNILNASFFSGPTFSLLDLKEELSTTMSVMEYLNLDLGIPVEEMEVHIITFLIKFKKTLQKLLINTFPTEESLNSVEISAEKLQYIKQWLSSNFGSHHLLNMNTDSQQALTRTNNKDPMNSQQNANISRMQQLDSGQPLHGYGGNRETSRSPYSYSVLSEDIDLSIFDNSNKVMLRDRSMLNKSSNNSNLNNTTVVSAKNNRKKPAKQPTKQQKTQRVAAEKELEIATVESSLPNSSFQVSSKGRIIKPKCHYWENASTMSTISSTTNVKRNIATGSDVLNTTVKEKTTSKPWDGVFKEPSAVLDKTQVPKPKRGRPASTPKPKEVKAKALNQSNASFGGLNRSCASGTKKNGKPASVENQNIKSETKRKPPTRRGSDKENVSTGTSPVVIKIERTAAQRGRKRTASLDKSVTVKKPKLDKNADKYSFDDSFEDLKSTSNEFGFQNNKKDALNNTRNKPVVNIASQSKPTGYSGSILDDSRSSSAMKPNVSAKVRTKVNGNTKQKNAEEQVKSDLGVQPLPMEGDYKNGKPLDKWKRSGTPKPHLTSVSYSSDSYSSVSYEYDDDSCSDLI